jgi:hypothetical protein
VQFVVGRNEETSAPETVFVSTARPPVDVTVVATDPNASEVGPDPGTFTFTRAGGDLTKPLTVYFSYVNNNIGTINPGSDFTDDAHAHLSIEQDRWVVIPANQTTVTVTITPRADNDVEGPEGVVALITPNRHYFVNSGPATVTIADTP